MNEIEGQIGRVSYRLRWELIGHILKLQIRRTGFLNRHWFSFEWRMKDEKELRSLQEAISAKKGGRVLPSVFTRFISRLLGIRFIVNLGQVGEKTGAETVTVYLGSIKGHEVVIFQRKAPGWSGYMEVPRNTFEEMVEQVSYGSLGKPSGVEREP